MKLFYSELTAAPAYYSFGYSVYGEFEPADSLANCYAQGFLPFVGAKNQPDNLMYMARGSRVRVQDFQERHYHGRVRRKFAEHTSGAVEVLVHERANFTITDEFIAFFLTYFSFRFGKGAMSEERLRAILDSSFITHISEYRLHGTAVGYMLEVHGTDFVHVWYQAYAREYERHYFGLYMYLDLLQRAREAGLQYFYFGVTYGTWMAYKTNFQPLEFWNGREWVQDQKSKHLKELLAADALRTLAFTDSWRGAHEPYYKAPYPFTSTRLELRFLMLVMNGTPRTFKLCLALVMLVALWVAYKTLGF